MKKLFTLMVMALVAMSASAEEVDITANFTYTWNSAESIVNNPDGTITFNAVSWGGLAGWFETDDGKADWSGYESITFEYAEATTVNTQIVVGDVKAWGDVGITKLTCSFDGKDVSAISQAALQASAATTITIKRVYLTKKESYTDPKELQAESGFIPASEFAGLSDGAKIEFTYTVAGDVTGYVGWGIGRIGSDDDEGEGPSVSVSSLNVNNLGDNSFTCKFADIKPALEATPAGIRVAFWEFGEGACTASLSSVKVSEVEGFSGEGYVPAGEESTSMAIIYSEMKAGDFTVANATKNTDESTDTKNVYDIAANEELQFTLNAAPNVVFTITNGSDKAKAFIVNVNGDDTTDKGSVEFGGKNGVVIFKDAKVGDVIKMAVAAKGGTAGTIGVLPSTGNDLIESTVITLPKKAKNTEGADADGYVWKEFSFTVTEDMIKTLDGVKVVRVKETAGGYRCKAASINADLPTGIQNVKAADVKSANGAIYNLAGQKVNESYKGIVIKNGKKYIQK